MPSTLKNPHEGCLRLKPSLGTTKYPTKNPEPARTSPLPFSRRWRKIICFVLFTLFNQHRQIEHTTRHLLPYYVVAGEGVLKRERERERRLVLSFVLGSKKVNVLTIRFWKCLRPFFPFTDKTNHERQSFVEYRDNSKSM